MKNTFFVAKKIAIASVLCALTGFSISVATNGREEAIGVLSRRKNPSAEEIKRRVKLRQFAIRMPKVLLHVHLEGAIRPETLIELGRKNNRFDDDPSTLAFTTVEEFKHACAVCYRNQKDISAESNWGFFRVFEQVVSCLKTPDDYVRVVTEFGEDCKKQNIQYAEVIFSMTTNCKFSGLSWDEILSALNRGRDNVWHSYGVELNWLFDLNTDQYIDAKTFVDRMIGTYRTRGSHVVAMGMSESIIEKGDSGGYTRFESPQLSTPGYPTYRELIEKAIKAGVPIVPHAGEFNPKNDSINTALNVCKSKRIDHGVQCIHYPDYESGLKLNLRKGKIWLNLCITSNMFLGAVESYAQHPIRRLWDDGIWVTIHTDDPVLLDTDLNKEYCLLVDHYNFTLEELILINRRAIFATLLSRRRKLDYFNRFDRENNEIRTEIFG